MSATPSFSFIPNPTLGGLSVQQIIETADRRTDRRGSKLLNLDAEFLVCLQEFCMETRWPWRRKPAVLQLQGGVWQYDLTSVCIPPIDDLHQFVKHGLHYYPNASQPTNWVEISPMFERDLQMSAIYSNNYIGNVGPPQRYFMMPGQWLILALDRLPNQDYMATIDYWAVPNVAIDSMPTSVPLVPGFLHHVLIKKMEAQILRFCLGEGAARYQAAMTEYSALVMKYQGTMGMVPGEQIDYSDDDQYERTWVTGASAVQSTN